MYQKMKNNRTFLVYREEDNLISVIFSFDEQKLNFQNVYEGILEMLRDTFGIKQVKVWRKVFKGITLLYTWSLQEIREHQRLL